MHLYFSAIVLFAAIVTTCKGVSDAPYTISSLEDCDKPPATTFCTFPADYTVPVSIASRIKSAEGQIQTYYDQLKSDSGACADAFAQVMCEFLVQPKCLGNGSVQFKQGIKQICNAALTTCTNPALVAVMQTLVCNNSAFDVVGTFPMKQCAVPNIVACNNTAPAPLWVKHYSETTLNDPANNYTQALLAAGYSPSCASKFVELKCALPQCGSNDVLQSVEFREPCEAIVACAPANQKAIMMRNLACDEFPFSSDPSATTPSMNPATNSGTQKTTARPPPSTKSTEVTSTKAYVTSTSAGYVTVAVRAFVFVSLFFAFVF